MWVWVWAWALGMDVGMRLLGGRAWGLWDDDDSSVRLVESCAGVWPRVRTWLVGVRLRACVSRLTEGDLLQHADRRHHVS